MKKSAIIKLVLVSTVMASCKTKTEEKEWSSGDDTKKKVYMRSDTSAGYSRSHYRNGLMFFAFRPYGSFLSGGSYRRTGFYSDAISHSSNIGRSSAKSTFSRGGFGSSSRRVSS